MTDSQFPVCSKADLEKLIKQHGGTLLNSDSGQKNVIILADKGIPYMFVAEQPPELVKVAALRKQGSRDILRPSWLLDSTRMGTLLPIEPRYFSQDMF